MAHESKAARLVRGTRPLSQDVQYTMQRKVRSLKTTTDDEVRKQGSIGQYLFISCSHYPLGDL